MGGMSAHVHSQLRNFSTTERMSSGRAQPVKRSTVGDRIPAHIVHKMREMTRGKE